MNLDVIATALPTAVSSCIYVGVHGIFTTRMLRRKRPPQRLARAPRVTVLKPVSGIDDDLRENLESFARLDYPDFEIVFGLASRADAAAPLLREFIAAHPELSARIAWTDPNAAVNPKVDQLIGMVREATGDIFVVSDANVCVGPTYLNELVHMLMKPGIGLVSSIVAGGGEKTIGATIENAQLGSYVAPAIVCSTVIVNRAITVGKSMAMRRVDLERVGGFRSVGNVLAEDDVLGQRFRAIGYGVDISLHAVENRNVHCTVSRSIDRHTRWAKMRRAIAPRCFRFELLLQPLLIAAMTFCIVPSMLAIRVLCLAWALQCLGVMLSLRLIRGRWPSWTLFALEPLRASIIAMCWARAMVSRRVEWRGNAFRIQANTELVPAVSGGPVSTRARRALLSLIS
jgi:ceramide glucosyltransferase